MNLNKNVQILLDNKKISNISFNENEMNSFGYESLNEEFFDVFVIKNNDLELIKEKKGEFNGNPIIEFDLCIENKKYEKVRFVLKKDGGVNINPKLLDHLSSKIFEESVKPIQRQEKVIKREVPVKKIETPVKRSVLTEQTLIRNEFDLIDKVRGEFLESIKDDIIDSLKKEIRAGIIADMLKENLQYNFDSFITNNDSSNKLHKLFEQTNNSFRKELVELIEKVSKREALRYAESGGGTNATQYANGGTMNGNLNLNGDLSVRNINVNNNLVSNGSLNVDYIEANDSLIKNNLTVSNLISSKDIQIDNNLVASNISSNYITANNDLTVLGNLTALNATLSSISYDSNNINLYNSNSGITITSLNGVTIENNLNVLDRISSNSIYINQSLEANSISSNYVTVNDDINIIGDLNAANANLSSLNVSSSISANKIDITNNLTVGGGVSAHGGKVFGDVLITGSLKVLNTIDGDLVTGNTIVNSNGDTLLAKLTRRISGFNIVDQVYNLTHNLSTRDLIVSVYAIDENENHEIVYPHVLNDTLSGCKISFGYQPSTNEQFKIVIMS